ncbi:hypothetical protein AB1Y20_010228 [Prymnesium parvum]|uniref:Bestrophin homolog n=1 Tax=Prymnesium parvum TaxID=97485 RepID=A0AB34K3V9_PRYPA
MLPLLLASAFVSPPSSHHLTLARHPPARCDFALPTGGPAGVALLKQQLAAVAELTAAAEEREAARSSLSLSQVVSGMKTSEPSFTRLFTHETWGYYTGKPPLDRWVMTSLTWRYSTVLRNVWPVCLIFAMFGSLVARVPPMLLPRINPFPLSLQGTAIGLLLVFRTNNSYLRLSEARELWGRAIVLCREIAQGMVLGSHVRQGAPSAAALHVCRYVTGLGWELAARLSKAEEAEEAQSNAVLLALLPEEEAAYLATTRSRPLELIRSMRWVVLQELEAGRLPPALYYKLEEDIRQLDLVVGSCERLFTSPLPPTMTRHLQRCLLLWLGALPICLAGSMAPLTIGVWVGVTAYIFTGIEDVGSQVEQPFGIVPMRKLSRLIQVSVEETIRTAPRPIVSDE